MKTCKNCGETKSLSSFNKATKSKDGKQAYCAICANKKNVEWNSKNVERKKGTHLKRTYGIDLYEYHAMLKEQQGVCAICYKPEIDKDLAVDHCHRTGQVRGLLCYMCNTSLGKMEDSPDRLRRAAAYLEGFLNDKS